MKRAGFLYELIPTHENLRKAFRKASKGKHRSREVIRFRSSFDENIQRIRDQLLNHTPDIGHYRFFEVRDPKRRTICAASFPEQVIHHAVMNICEPYLDSYAIYDSYACRKGKGNRRALQRAREFTRKNRWYLKLDIAKYFDSIDHAAVMNLLSRRFRDKALLGLFEKLLDTYHSQPGKGVPIGNLISQHLANFYLGRFDHWVKGERGIKGYVRYMDDFILFGRDDSFLKSELTGIKAFLADHLSLTLKSNIQLNRCVFGVPFLGFRVFPNHIRLLPVSLRRYSEKLRIYETNYIRGEWSARELVRHLEPLIEFTEAGECVPFRRMIHQRFGVLS